MDYIDEILTVINADMFTFSPESKKRLGTALGLWFLNDAKKKPSVADFDNKVVAYVEELGELADHIKIELVENRYVVTTNGSRESTLRDLRIGTNWFDPHKNIDGFILEEMLK